MLPVCIGPVGEQYYFGQLGVKWCTVPPPPIPLPFLLSFAQYVMPLSPLATPTNLSRSQRSLPSPRSLCMCTPLCMHWRCCYYKHPYKHPCSKFCVSVHPSSFMESGWGWQIRLYQQHPLIGLTRLLSKLPENNPFSPEHCLLPEVVWRSNCQYCCWQ